MGDSSRDTLPEAERVPTDEVCTLTVGVVQGVEEVGRRRAQKILDVLLQHVDVLAGRVLGNKAIIICIADFRLVSVIMSVHGGTRLRSAQTKPIVLTDGEDILLLRNHVAKASAC